MVFAFGERKIQIRLCFINLEKAIIHFCQLDLDKKDEKIIYDLILNAYRELDSKDPLE